MRKFISMMTVSVLSLTLACTFASTVWANEGPVKVKVSLYPMGSFELVAERLIGTGEKKGEVYTAKELKVAVSGLKTGMSLRDKHTHEKLEAEKYPFITITDVKASGSTGTAKITIRNVTKDVKFTFNPTPPNRATAEFKLSLKDFNFSGISYQGVGVEDEVQVSATVPYTSK